MNSPFFFQPEILKNLAERYRLSYEIAKPFPHAVFDNFLPEHLLEDVLAEFLPPNNEHYNKYNNVNEKKIEMSNEAYLGSATRHLIAQFNSSTFVNFLEHLSGIQGLIPDPHLMGGGLHQIVSGGMLGIHADFNWYPRLKLDRRVNFLLYLNKDWKDEYGGHLELWNASMTNCEQKILPIFNRLVIFSSTDRSYHGHPLPLTCPEDWSRKSLALYYYTNGRPVTEKTGAHSTVFKRRPGEIFELDPKLGPGQIFKMVSKKFIPPILLDFLRLIKNRIVKK